MKEQVLMQNGFCEMSSDEMMELDGGMSAMGAVCATVGIAAICWAAPVGIVCGVGYAVTMVGGGIIATASAFH